MPRPKFRHRHYRSKPVLACTQRRILTLKPYTEKLPKLFPPNPSIGKRYIFLVNDPLAQPFKHPPLIYPNNLPTHHHYPIGYRTPSCSGLHLTRLCRRLLHVYDSGLRRVTPADLIFPLPFARLPPSLCLIQQLNSCSLFTGLPRQHKITCGENHHIMTFEANSFAVRFRSKHASFKGGTSNDQRLAIFSIAVASFIAFRNERGNFSHVCSPTLPIKPFTNASSARRSSLRALLTSQ
ncbi:hypothetical protein J6590_048196 [Homalodisca vitripennis]|nr:hypothetical protein J6590_048196 [Homalodisca vitripennis]